jgi:hypothetical protein
MQDFFTHTEADAGAWDRNHLEADDFSDAPSRAEAEADLAADAADAYHAGPDTVVGYGIRCAHCHNRHETIADVRWCSDLQAEYRAEALAEQAAEARAERYFEEGPESFQMMRAAEEAHDQARAWNDPWITGEPPATTTINHGNSGACEGGACSWHDKCRKHREQDVANGDRLGNFRAYND